MAVYIIQHVPFESIGLLKQLKDYRMIRMFAGDVFPSAEEVSLLVIMGGPMNVDEDIEWLKREKAFIKEVLESGKAVLGICLGAQLIAQLLGGEVDINPQGKEVGWWPVTKTAAVPALDFLPAEMMVLHWHGDTFSLPEEATLLYSSPACRNQAFLYRDNVIGLQFHLETDQESLAGLMAADEDYLDGSPYVQAKEEILTTAIPAENKRLLKEVVTYLLAR